MIDRLFSRTRDGRDQLEAALRAVIPTVGGVLLEATGGGAKTLEFALPGDGPERIVPCDLVSDGVMLATGLITLALTDTADILLIEEPENGLHPGALAKVVETLRAITRGDIGPRPRQVVLTTHSPILLNHIEPHEVRVLTRPDGGATVVTSMADLEGVERLREEFGTGELWYMLGEEAMRPGEAAGE